MSVDFPCVYGVSTDLTGLWITAGGLGSFGLPDLPVDNRGILLFCRLPLQFLDDVDRNALDLAFLQGNVPVFGVFRVQEDRVPVLFVPFQRVAFSFDIGDDDVAVPGFLLLSDQDQVTVVDAGAGHAVAAGMEHEKVALSEDSCRQLDDFFDRFLFQGEIPAGDTSDDPHVDGFLAGLVGDLGDDGFPVVVDDPAVSQGVQHALHGHVGDAGSGGDLPEGGGPVVVPVEVVDEGDDPVHGFGIAVLHGCLLCAFRSGTFSIN